MKAIVLWKKSKKSPYSMSDVPLEGYTLFIQNKPEDEVEVLVYLEGLEDGNHGFHIHEKGFSAIHNCMDATDCCKLLGGHFNVGPSWSLEEPHGTKHGDHNGDLCFNIFSENGVVSKKFYSSKISLFPGEKSVINRSLVIHEDEDDEGKGQYEDEEKNIESLITGNAGKRIACGEIRKVDEKSF